MSYSATSASVMHRCGRSQRRVMHVTQTIRHPTRCSTLAVNRPSCSVLGTSTLPIDEIPTPRPTSSASSASQCSASAFAPVEALLKGFRSPLTSSYSMMICPGEIPRLGTYHGIWTVHRIGWPMKFHWKDFMKYYMKLVHFALAVKRRSFND